MQQGFHECVGMTPMEYLADVRLELVHADLIGNDSSETVSDIAIRWGITHTGRFAAAYRRKYGLTPSETSSATSRPDRRIAPKFASAWVPYRSWAG